MIDRSDVLAAQGRLGSLVRRTPVLDALVDTVRGPVPVTFKLEYLQISGSFKFRGSLNALLHSGRHRIGWECWDRGRLCCTPAGDSLHGRGA